MAIMIMSVLLPFSAFGANPFLDVKDDKPVSATFRGSEWGDEIEQDEIPLAARVITTRIVKMAWGAIFKIEFIDLKSRALQSRKIEREYVVVTDSRIALLNEEDVDAAIKRFSALAKPPEIRDGRHLRDHQRQLRSRRRPVENDNHTQRRPMHL
jgi:hypothetical protein